MNIPNENISWHIPVENIWKHFQKNKMRLKDEMDIICEYAFDDAISKWYLYVTTDFGDNDTLLLSLETMDEIVDSSTIADPTNIPATVARLLEEI